ncbi:unnamed protein product, partial [Chrysoparadoxa australica]
RPQGFACALKEPCLRTALCHSSGSILLSAHIKTELPNKQGIGACAKTPLREKTCQLENAKQKG